MINVKVGERVKRAKEDKRGFLDEPFFLDENTGKFLLDLVEKLGSNRKVNIGQMTLRDRALFAFLILTGCRISEAVKIKRKQLKIYDDRILLVNVQSLKHGDLRKKIIISRVGKQLSPISEFVVEWLETIKDGESYIFCRATPQGEFMYDSPLSRKTCQAFIYLCTGLFPHWPRGVHATIQARIFGNNAWKLTNYMGWKRMESSKNYVRGSWEEDENKIMKY